MKKAYQTFVRGLVGLVTCVYIATIICLLVQVFARYVLKVPTPWLWAPGRCLGAVITLAFILCVTVCTEFPRCY